MQALADELNALRNTLSAQREGWLTGELQLREKLGGLYGAVNFYDGRPTASMLDNLKLMEKDLGEATTKLQGIFAKDLPGVNAALAKAKLEAVTTMTREDWEKKQGSGGGAAKSGEEGALNKGD